MDAMNSLANSTNSFNSLLKSLREDFPAITFVAGDLFRWSDENRTIYFDESAESPLWSLLHEVGHMSRNHSVYNSDTTLVRMEIEAWESAKKIGLTYGIEIDDEHIQDCMDSYRNWQHKRSACPVCKQTGVERSNGLYTCINCREQWHVSTNRFCRVYRRTVSAGN